MPTSLQLHRCSWCLKDPEYITYHDVEWGLPCYEEKKLFEMLLLEGMQAGLSWLTILKKRKAFADALADFDPSHLAKFTETDLGKLMQNEKIIRSKSKLSGSVENAKAYLNMRDRGESLSNYFWQFTDGKPLQNAWKDEKEVPCSTPLSEKMARELKKNGFRFVGPKICYSLMQAVGMVNDHITSCFRHQEVQDLSCCTI